MSNRKRDFILFIEEIIVAINKIEKYTEDFSLETFIANDMVVDAVIRNFEIIGEAVANIPKEIIERYAGVEWREAKGFRNIMIHNYFGVDVESVWETIENDIPKLKTDIINVLNDINKS